MDKKTLHNEFSRAINRTRNIYRQMRLAKELIEYAAKGFAVDDRDLLKARSIFWQFSRQKMAERAIRSATTPAPKLEYQFSGGKVSAAIQSELDNI